MSRKGAGVKTARDIVSNVRGRRMSMRQLAQELGLSQSSVSRVLNGSYAAIGIPEATAEKVRQRSAARSYVRHAGAVAMKRQRFNAVGVLVSNTTLEERLFSPALDGICGVMAAAGKTLSILKMPNLDCPRSPAQPLEIGGVDGLIVTYTLPDWVEKYVTSLGLPTTWINADDQPRPNSIRFDDAQCTRLAVTHLIGLGHRSIWYLNCSGNTHYSVPNRWTGYRDAMRAAGLPIPRGAGDFVTDENVPTWITAQLRATPPPSAFVCYNDLRALQVLQCAYLQRWRVPDRLSVIGVDDSPFCQFSVPSLTSARLPIARAAELAAEQLVNLMRDGGRPLAPQVLSPTLIVRESTGPVGNTIHRNG